MAEPAATRTLVKTSPHRSVWFETAPGSRPLLIKRFEHRTALGRLRDRSRAEREHEMLALLAGRGLLVPQPRGIAERDGAIELAMDAVLGAVPADSLGKLPDRHVHVLAERAGLLLARVHVAGVVHGDLHLSNLLVQQYRVWLIDLGHARIVRRISRRRVLADLAQLAGLARERWPARARSRFLIVFAREITHITVRLGDRRALAVEVEALAPRLRRASVERNLDRWTRASGLMTALPTSAGSVLVRANVGSTLRARLQTTDWSKLRHASIHLHSALSRPALLADWRSMARLSEHCVPALAPLALDLVQRRALFETPPSGAASQAALLSCASNRLLRLIDPHFAHARDSRPCFAPPTRAT